MGDYERSKLLVDAATNDGPVRTYYELPDDLVDRVRTIAGAPAHGFDTLAFDQALHVALDRLNPTGEDNDG